MKKKPKKRNWTNLTDEEKEFIAALSIQYLSSLFGVGRPTIANWKQRLKDEGYEVCDGRIRKHTPRFLR